MQIITLNSPTSTNLIWNLIHNSITEGELTQWFSKKQQKKPSNFALTCTLKGADLSAVHSCESTLALTLTLKQQQSAKMTGNVIPVLSFHFLNKDGQLLTWPSSMKSWNDSTNLLNTSCPCYVKENVIHHSRPNVYTAPWPNVSHLS